MLKDKHSRREAICRVLGVLARAGLVHRARSSGMEWFAALKCQGRIGWDRLLAHPGVKARPNSTKQYGRPD